MSINLNQLSNKISTILNEARQQGSPFVVEWRPERSHSQSHVEYDAGCGCGPVEVPKEPAR